MRDTPLLLAAAALVLAGCSFGVREKTGPDGRRSAEVAPGLTLGTPNAAVCPYRLSTNQQCYASLQECREAGALRTTGGPTGFTCESDPSGAGARLEQTAAASAAEELLPASLLGAPVRFGMTLEEARKAFPESTLKPVEGTWSLVQLKPYKTIPYQEKGTIGYIAQGVIHDERLVGGLVAVAFVGKSPAQRLAPEELQQLQAALAAECERTYGPASRSGVVPFTEGKTQTRSEWDRQAYKVTLSTPDQGLGLVADLIGTLGAMARSSAPNDMAAEDMRRTLNSIGLKTK